MFVNGVEAIAYGAPQDGPRTYGGPMPTYVVPRGGAIGLALSKAAFEMRDRGDRLDITAHCNMGAAVLSENVSAQLPDYARGHGPGMWEVGYAALHKLCAGRLPSRAPSHASARVAGCGRDGSRVCRRAAEPTCSRGRWRSRCGRTLWRSSARARDISPARGPGAPCA